MTSVPVNIEEIILANLCLNEDYTRTVYPFLQEEYFQTLATKRVFDFFNLHFAKYNTLPTRASILIDIENSKTLDSTEFESVKTSIDSIFGTPEYVQSDPQWLRDQTEEFCKNARLYNALMKSVDIADGNEKTIMKTAIPDLLSEALGFSFDTRVGHSFFKDAQERFDFYHNPEAHVATHLEKFNDIMRGGPARKSLSVFMGPSGSGKSIVLADLAGGFVALGEKVLYISLELEEKKIAERIDASRMNISLEDLYKLSEDDYLRRIQKINSLTTGELIIKDYPNSSAHVGNFRFLLRELKQKNKFVPTVILIDYLSICASSKLKAMQRSDPYLYYKSIAEEIRAFATENDVPIITALQTNRNGYNNTDIDEKDTAESMGIFHTADFFGAIIITDELLQKKQIMFKQLKNRWGPVDAPRFYIVGHDRSKMKLYDVAESEQQNLMGNESVSKAPVFTKGGKDTRTISEKKKDNLSKLNV